LAQFPREKINNHYVAKIKPGKHSLILPLGAKADLTIDLGGIARKENYTLKLIDISGIEWTAEIK
jgi:thiosulfate dehydrogenase [quinone] large subunit